MARSGAREGRVHAVGEVDLLEHLPLNRRRPDEPEITVSTEDDPRRPSELLDLGLSSTYAREGRFLLTTICTCSSCIVSRSIGNRIVIRDGPEVLQKARGAPILRPVRNLCQSYLVEAPALPPNQSASKCRTIYSSLLFERTSQQYLRQMPKFICGRRRRCRPLAMLKWRQRLQVQGLPVR